MVVADAVSFRTLGLKPSGLLALLTFSLSSSTMTPSVEMMILGMHPLPTLVSAFAIEGSANAGLN